MKILGFEINRAKTASDEIKVVKSQGTKPAVPLKKAQPRAELGDTGVRMSSGIIMEEYNPELRGQAGIKVYDKMRRSDGTVQAVVKACILPVQRATWFIDYQTENPDDQKTKDIKAFVEKALFNWIEDTTWDDIVRQALIALPLGVSIFEKVYGVKTWNGKDHVTLKKLSPRLPQSVYSWELPGGTFGIQQQRSDGALVDIPGSKLVIFVNEKEGDNWYGTSILRSAYKHWYYKDRFYNIDAMSAERQGMGVPLLKMPTGYTKRDMEIAENAMSNLRSNASAYLILPSKEYEAEFMNMGASNTKDLTKSIEMHDKAILTSTLTQFLSLGQSGGGSYALGKDQSDIFLKAEETVANMITSSMNKVIKELVDLNFTDVENYPELSYSGIAKDDVSGLSTAYKSLTDAGAIKPIDSDESYWRGMLGLPALTQEDKDKREQDDAEDMLEEQQNNPAKTPQDPEEMEIEDTNTANKTNNKKVDKAVEQEPVDASDRGCGCGGKHGKTKERKFDDGSGYKSWRPLTFAEKKVTFNNIEQTMTELEDQFEAGAKGILQEIKDKYMSKINKALQDGDAKMVKELEIKFATEYKTHLKSIMKSAYEYGKNNAATEMGVQIPASSADDIANMDLLADSITEKTIADIMAVGKIGTVNELQSANNAIQSAAIIDQLLNEAVDNSIINTRGLIVNESLNRGRNRIFETNKELIYALQRSEILDKDTCNFCLSMDGRVIEADSKWAKTGSFHSNCRGIWVEILKSEENPPEIAEIPSNLADYYGGHPNELIQPPRVMPAPGTLAEEYVKSKKK